MSDRCEIPEHATLAAELDQVRAEHQVLERFVMGAALPTDEVERRLTDGVLATRPALPYRSTTVDGLSGVTVAEVDGAVVIDGLAHTPAAALELFAAIARAVRETTTTGGRCG